MEGETRRGGGKKRSEKIGRGSRAGLEEEGEGGGDHPQGGLSAA